MTEPDVALTDYALALEGVLFLVLFQRRRARPGGLRPWFSLFFASVSAASLCGGTVHGFLLDEQILVQPSASRTRTDGLSKSPSGDCYADTP